MKTPDLIIRDCVIADPTSSFNGKVCDVRIIDGVIDTIKDSHIEASSIREISAKGFEMIPGVFDFQVNCGEPGEEVKETFETLSNSGVYGGVTGMLVMPSASPATDNRGQIEYRKRKSEDLPVTFMFAGNITNEGKGKQLTEMKDLRLGGAVAFSDNKLPADNSLVIHLAMQYSKITGGTLLFHPEDSTLRMSGIMHEGAISVQLGMKEQPSLAEGISVTKLISLAEYNSLHIHISGVSTKGSIELIKQAKAKNIDISCSVYAQNLFFCDEDLLHFNSVFKVWPPLRGKEDRAALIEGVKMGIIDIVCSDHRPETVEFKEVEFDYAAFGMSGTQTLLQAVLSSLGDLSTEKIVSLICFNPRKVLDLEINPILEGAKADFVLIDRNKRVVIDKNDLYSLSVNNPFVDRKLNGEILGTYTNSQWFSRY